MKRGIFIKKYHLADASTAIEIIMAFILIGMTIYHVPADIAIWFFIIGELADAFDGPCNRRWPYPDDGKYRWWRVPQTVKRIEHFSDIFIAVSCMLYLISQPNHVLFVVFDHTFIISECAMSLGFFIIVCCAFLEVIIRILRHQNESTFFYAIKGIILTRRLIYAFIGIGGVFLLIMATSWGFKVKFTAVFAGIIAGILLLIYKLDRATDPS